MKHKANNAALIMFLDKGYELLLNYHRFSAAKERCPPQAEGEKAGVSGGEVIVG